MQRRRLAWLVVADFRVCVCPAAVLAQDKVSMFKEMHKVRNMYLARLHERLARDMMRNRMDDQDK